VDSEECRRGSIGSLECDAGRGCIDSPSAVLAGSTTSNPSISGSEQKLCVSSYTLEGVVDSDCSDEVSSTVWNDNTSSINLIYEADDIENTTLEYEKKPDAIPSSQESIHALEESMMMVSVSPMVQGNKTEPQEKFFVDDSSGGASIEYETDITADLSRFSDTLEHSNKLENSSKPTVKTDISHMSTSLTNNMQHKARNFAMEHRIFIKCLMDLLAQRALTAADADNPHTLKYGPLKKATHIVKGAWKVKYVEIRRGMFSYYDDSLSKAASSEGDLVRKDIRLNAKATCRAVKLNHKSLTHAVSIQGKVFELTVEGSPRRFWMANSRQERSAWIRAINDAMVGDSIIRDELQVVHSGRSRKVSRKSPYKSDLATYLKIQREIKSASSKRAYVGALSCIIGKVLNVPVRWISEQNNEETEKAFVRDSVSTSVGQLWKDLARDSLRINDELFTGGSGHVADKIIGGLACEIMRTDRTSPLRPKDPSFMWRGVTELQALSFASDVLLSGNRTRSGGDSYYCVDALCQNAGLVVLVPSSLEAEPLSIRVGHPFEEQKNSGAPYSMHDRSGWLKTRTRNDRKWQRRYFVLSEGTLSFYKKAHPKPYNLEGQIKVLETPIYVAAITSTGADEKKDGETGDKMRFTLTFRGKEGLLERQLRFEDDSRFLLWAYALEATISQPEPRDSPKKNGIFGMLHIRDEPKGDSRVGFILSEKSLELHAAELGFDPESITSRGKALSLQYGGTKSPTVNVSVRASTVYKVCTLDPQGVESEDTWATICANFMQTFSIVGGHNGLMNRSEEIVQIEVMDCKATEDESQLNLESNISPRSLVGIKRKIRRQVSQDGVATSDRADSS